MVGFLRRGVEAVGYKVVQASRWGLPAGRLDLTGDRDIEWSFLAAQLPKTPGRVLDLGPADSFTPMISAFAGGNVLALDLQAPPVPFAHPNLTYRRGDVLSSELPKASFDTIVNCSTTEHIGISGRYGSGEDEDGDLKAMAILRDVMAGPEARMLFTIPVGRDGVFRPFHRVYGAERLPRVLTGFEPVVELYYAKTGNENVWKQVSRDRALDVPSAHDFYALGLFVLAVQ